MGKRKSRAKPAPKKRTDRLDTVFNCPFCNHEKSVECTFDRDNKIGMIACRICQESYSTSINALTEAVDVTSITIGDMFNDISSSNLNKEVDIISSFELHISYYNNVMFSLINLNDTVIVNGLTNANGSMTWMTQFLSALA